MVLGLISDTHGLLRPEALDALQGVDAIVHAGDVGSIEVLEGLETIAPVHAIRGNVDRAGPTAALPDTLDLELGGLRIHVAHDRKSVSHDLAGVDLLVVGHSHEAGVETQGGCLVVNPGGAGRRRFSLPITVARVEVKDGVPAATILPLLD